MEAVFDFIRAALPWVAMGLLLAVFAARSAGRKKNKTVLITLPLLILTGVAVFLLCTNQENFTGSRVKNPDEYLLDIEKMNGTDLHTLELQEGDVLDIQFETVKGSLYMEIKAPDGTSIYRGNGKETTEFAVNIRESGVYTVVVEARHAKGTIHISAGDDE